MATLKDVSIKAGTSLSSVVRVLKGENVSEDIKRAVIKAKNELKYRMDLDTEDLIRYKIVVYIGKLFSKSFFVLSVLEGLKEAAGKYGCEIAIIILGSSNLIKQGDIDGVLAVATDIDEERELDALYGNRNIPLLLVNRKCNLKKISYITIDHYDAAYEAVNYLISLGHKKIAVVRGIENLEPNIERLEGCIRAFQDSNTLLEKDMIINGGNSEKHTFESVKKFLKGNNIPTAFFALSDEMTIGTIKAIIDSGMKVPYDFSVIGFDVSSIFTFTDSSLTTIKVSGERMGQLGIETVLKLVENKDIQQEKVIIRHELFTGNSTVMIKEKRE